MYPVHAHRDISQKDDPTMNPITALLTATATTARVTTAYLVSAVVLIAGIGAGFVLPEDNPLTVLGGSCAGVAAVAMVVLTGRHLPLLHRSRWSERTRRITGVSLVGLWVLASTVLTRSDALVGNLGGAAMVAVVLAAIGFTLPTPEETRARIEAKHAAEQAARTRDIFTPAGHSEAGESLHPNVASKSD